MNVCDRVPLIYPVWLEYLFGRVLKPATTIRGRYTFLSRVQNFWQQLERHTSFGNHPFAKLFSYTWHPQRCRQLRDVTMTCSGVMWHRLASSCSNVILQSQCVCVCVCVCVCFGAGCGAGLVWSVSCWMTSSQCYMSFEISWDVLTAVAAEPYMSSSPHFSRHHSIFWFQPSVLGDMTKHVVVVFHAKMKRNPVDVWWVISRVYQSVLPVSDHSTISSFLSSSPSASVDSAVVLALRLSSSPASIISLSSLLTYSRYY